MKKFYLLVLIYLFINILVSSAKAAESAVYVYLSGLEDSQVVNYRNDVPIEVIKGDSIKLKAVSDDTETGNKYYLWQRSRDGQHWEVINVYWLEDNEYEGIVYHEGLMYYRVVVSSENFTYYNLYDVDIDSENSAISSPIEIVSKTLELKHEILTQKPCVYGNPLIIRLSVKNTLSRNVENVKVAFDESYSGPIELSAIDGNSGFDDSVPLWNIGTILAGETKTVDVKVESSSSYVLFSAYITSADNIKWPYSNYASQLIQIEKELKVNMNGFYLPNFEHCGTLEPDTLEFASYYNVDKDIIKFYEDAERQKEVVGVDTSEPILGDGQKYYAVFVDQNGCESELIDFNVKIKEIPKLVKIEPVDTVLCNANGEIPMGVTINYKIEGADAPYYIYYTCTEFDNFGYGYESIIMVNSNEGSFQLYPAFSSEYRITYVSDQDNCSAKQDVPVFRIYTPKTNDYYLSTAFDNRLIGEDYVVSFEDNNAEFDIYQWQVSYDNGNTFEDLIDTVNPEDTVNVVSGAQTTSLKISNLGPQSCVLKYRIKLISSASPCLVYYSKPACMSMQSTEDLAFRVPDEFIYTDYICENEMVKLICELSNYGIETKKNLNVKLDMSDSLEELTVVPSVGEYNYSTKIWTIDKIDGYDSENISLSFRAKGNERITFSLTDEVDFIDLYKSINVNVLKAPIVGELQTPNPICEGETLVVEAPSISNEAQVIGVTWLLDGTPIGIGNSLSRKQDGAILQCEVLNMCGSTLSNAVAVQVNGVPEVVGPYTSSGTLCEGEPLNIPAPEILSNGSVIKSEGWLLDGVPYIEGTPIVANGKGFYEVMYEVEGECGGKQISWSNVYNVARNVVMSELKEPGPICDNSILYLQTPMLTVGGANIVSEKWILDGNEYNDEELSSAMNGAKLYYEVVQTCNASETVVRSNEVTVTVLPAVEIADIPNEYEVQEGEMLQLQAPKVEYEVEANDVIKYQTSWNLLNEYDSVIMDDYAGQNITSEGENLKLVYTVRPVIYMSPESFFICETQYSNVAQILRPTISSVFEVEAENDESILPTAITPYNENGLNDVFAEGMHVMIFDNRYQQIFEGDNGWDGTANMGWGSKNRVQPPGVYYYSVVLPSGEKKVGIVEIVRM